MSTYEQQCWEYAKWFLFWSAWVLLACCLLRGCSQDPVLVFKVLSKGG